MSFLDKGFFVYIIVVKETGKKFWSTKDPGQQPFSYNAGVGQVITTGFVGNADREEQIIDYFFPLF